MTKLKLGPLPDDKPVKVTLELPATLNRDLIDYADVLARETGHPACGDCSLGRVLSRIAPAGCWRFPTALS